MRAELVRWQQQCLAERSAQDVALTHPDDLHMTLAFLGEVSEQQLPAVKAVGEEISASSFELTLDHIGHFAGTKALWAGVAAKSQGLMALHDDLCTHLTELGFEREPRAYCPHVTLARKARAPVDCEVNPLIWTVRQWGLIASRPGARPLYHPLALWALK